MNLITSSWWWCCYLVFNGWWHMDHKISTQWQQYHRDTEQNRTRPGCTYQAAVGWQQQRHHNELENGAEHCQLNTRHQSQGHLTTASSQPTLMETQWSHTELQLSAPHFLHFLVRYIKRQPHNCSTSITLISPKCLITMSPTMLKWSLSDWLDFKSLLNVWIHF